MKAHQYCYRITKSGSPDDALFGGTVTATSMEDAAETAAKQVGLEKMVVDHWGQASIQWTKDGAKRYIYVRHNPSL